MTTGPVAKKIRILVCDDNKPLRLLLTRMIAKHGYEVHEAASGGELLAMVNAGNRFDLILLDVLMDDLSGLDVLREIRIVREDRETKICMATGKSDPQDVATAINLGADDYIVKPIYEEILIPKIEKLTGTPVSTGFARLAVNLKAIAPEGPIVPDMIAVEIGEEGFNLLSTARLAPNLIIPVKIPSLENMIDFGGKLHCKITSCSREGFGRYFVRCDFVGISEGARSQLRALAMRGAKLADTNIEAGVAKSAS